MAKKVLIVDNEPSVGMLLKIGLRERGFEAETVESGAEALTRATERVFDLLILDVALPAMSGIELCRALREQPSYEETPILMISSRCDNLTVEAARAAGASDYLFKPFTFPDLSRRVDDLLARPSLF